MLRLRLTIPGLHSIPDHPQLVRQRPRRKWAQCVLVLLGLVWFGLYGASVAAEELAAVQALHRGNGAEPQTLDPHKAEDVSSANILRDLYEGLVGEAPDGTLIPGAAERWQVNADGTEYTFYLRRNARWSNGDPVTAEDFVAGLRRAVDPLTASHYAQVLAPIRNAAAVIAGQEPPTMLGARAVDAYTLQIELIAPTPYFLGLLTHSTTYPIHRPSLAQHGARFTRPGNLISNGAYRLSEWVVHSHIKLARNTHYWDNVHTTIDEVSYYPTEDSNGAFKRYRAGGLDWTGTVPLNQFRWIRENLADELQVAPYLGTYFYGFNITRPPFKDAPGLRHALSMVIDREILTGKITGAGEVPAYGWVPPGVAGYEAQGVNFSALTPAQRLAEARRLYAAAGYSRVRPLEIELRYNTSENHKKVAVAIAAMWKQALGVKTRLVNEEWKVFLETRKQKVHTQVFRAGWIGDYNDPYTFAELFHSGHGRNDTGFVNVDYDRLLQKASLTTDAKTRMLLLEQAERILLAEHTIVPIYFYVSKRLVKPYIKGYAANILDHHHSKHMRVLKH